MIQAKAWITKKKILALAKALAGALVAPWQAQRKLLGSFWRLLSSFFLVIGASAPIGRRIVNLRNIFGAGRMRGGKIASGVKITPKYLEV